MKIISYCLFDKKYNIDYGRTWDIYRNDENRYWSNLPMIIILNTIYLPEYVSRIYISKNVCDNSLYEIINFLKTLDNFEVIEVDIDYNATEPSIWRMLPFWEDIDIMICRDIDSLLTINEYKTIQAFEKNEYLISTLRSHDNHNIRVGNTRILAGLCSFRPKLLRTKGYINIESNFEEYYKTIPKNNWSMDQLKLIDIFYNKIPIDIRKKIFLDIPTRNINKLGLNDTCDSKYIDNIIFEEYYDELLYDISLYTKWIGEPISFKGYKLLDLLDKYKKEYHVVENVYNFIISDEKLKEFYL